MIKETLKAGIGKVGPYGREGVGIGRKAAVLEEQEVQNFFSTDNLDSEKWDMVFDFLDANKVDILRIGNDDDMEPDLFEEDIDLEQIDLSVPDGIGMEDPVRMYLKDIGKILLLSPEEELEWICLWSGFGK